MDKSKKYIKMCQTAIELQIKKYRSGFEEGDFVFDGQKVRVIGYDFLNIRAKFKYEARPVFYFAMMENYSDVSWIQEGSYPSIVTSLMKGKYTIEKLYSPIWLPRLDQLMDLVKDSVVYHSRVGYFTYTDMMFAWLRREGLPLGVNSEEQLWLIFVMRKLYGKEWQDGWKKFVLKKQKNDSTN